MNGHTAVVEVFILRHIAGITYVSLQSARKVCQQPSQDREEIEKCGGASRH